MKTTVQYTTFVGDINALNEELKKASGIGKKPILISSETSVSDDTLKKRSTTYTIIFEQPVLAS